MIDDERKSDCKTSYKREAISASLVWVSSTG
jgi:hypothetical protein